MTKAVKKANKKNLKATPTPQRSTLPLNNGVLYEIEADPPPPPRSMDLHDRLQKIDATIAILRPGQAFIMPNKSLAKTRKHISRTYPNEVFKVTKVLDNEQVVRIYYLRSNKKPVK